MVGRESALIPVTFSVLFDEQAPAKPLVTITNLKLVNMLIWFLAQYVSKIIINILITNSEYYIIQNDQSYINWFNVFMLQNHPAVKA